MGKKLGIIGSGKLGEAIASGVAARGFVEKADMILADGIEPRRAELAAKGFRTTADNAEAVRASDAVILSVKPKDVDAALDGIRAELGPKKLLISTVAGTALDILEAKVPKGTPVIRTMPNMAAAIGESMTVLSPGSAVGEADLEWAAELFRSVGRALVLEERHMDAVTGLSGSGPAYIYVVIEALADGGLKLGLPRAVALELAAQTVLGAARSVLVSGEHPAKLKDMVTTPAGTTVEGLCALEEDGLRPALIHAVERAAKRSKELARK